MHINNNKISSQAAFCWGKQNANLSFFLDYGRGMEDERFCFFLPSMLRKQTSISDHLSWCLSYVRSNLCTVTDTVGCCRFALCSWTISPHWQTNEELFEAASAPHWRCSGGAFLHDGQRFCSVSQHSMTPGDVWAGRAQLNPFKMASSKSLCACFCPNLPPSWSFVSDRLQSSNVVVPVGTLVT